MDSTPNFERHPRASRGIHKVRLIGICERRVCRMGTQVADRFIGVATERPYLRRFGRVVLLNHQFSPLRFEVPCRLRQVRTLCLVSPLGRYGSQLTEEVPLRS